MNNEFKVTHTQLVDISFLLENNTSTLLIKREDEQITGSHKYRLAEAMVSNCPLPLGAFDGYAECSSGNTGLALVELTSALHKPLKLFTTSNINPYLRRKLHKRSPLELIEYDDIEDAYRACCRFAEFNDKWIHLDQYNNPDAIEGFRKLGREIIKDVNEAMLPEVTTIVMGVGTGATLTGLASVMPQADVIACTVDDPTGMITVPGWKNFRNATIHNTVFELHSKNPSWRRFTVAELVEAQPYISEKLGEIFGAGSGEPFLLNLSTIGNILAAVEEGDSYNDQVVLTLSTGFQK